MNLKNLLMPYVTQRLFSPKAFARRRAAAEQKRIKRGEQHVVSIFIQVDDPYCSLLLQTLPQFANAYDIELALFLVGEPADAVAPEREKLVAYSRKDAALLAKRWGLQYTDPGVQPTASQVGNAQAALAHLLAHAPGANILETLVQASEILTCLWQGQDAPARPMLGTEETRACLRKGNAQREKLGHYLSGMLYYGGEWYWGIDRLHHLEERLRGLNVRKPPKGGGLMLPPHKLQGAGRTPAVSCDGEAPVIDFFFSFRSPYSAIVAPRIFELARHLDVSVNLRFVLPMVMRGLPVPPAKRSYIVMDTAREAHVHGTPFGKLCDPVGLPTERGLAVMPLAISKGLGQAYVESFMQGVWAEGIDAGTDSGLRKITHRAGLAWEDVLAALADESWRQQAEANRQALFDLGLWGVPSFAVGQQAFWGQDRLWAVEDAVRESASAANGG